MVPASFQAGLSVARGAGSESNRGGGTRSDPRTGRGYKLTDPRPAISAYHDMPYAIFRYPPEDELAVRQEMALLRTRLDASGVTYEYLDGRTKDRAERVERFSTDPACRLFLISLKAGGVGLNLTAAEYVFLLDPWWNPAAEAQAIDRAHRIGQSRHVFAYRLIAKDTVEEKVAQLQASKRQLADAILSADPALIRNLKPEDLDLLLS